MEGHFDPDNSCCWNRIDNVEQKYYHFSPSLYLASLLLSQPYSGVQFSNLSKIRSSKGFFYEHNNNTWMRQAEEIRAF